MSEFTFLFRGRQTAASPEQRQKHTEKWIADVMQEPFCPGDGSMAVSRGSRESIGVAHGPGEKLRAGRSAAGTDGAHIRARPRPPRPA